MVFPGTLASIFATDKTLISYSAWAMRIYMAASVIFGAQIACQQTFIALGNAKTSLVSGGFTKNYFTHSL